MNKKLFSILSILLTIFDSIPCKNLKSFAEKKIATITKDDEQDLRNAVDILNKNGGVIYINTPVINISGTTTINLSSNVLGGIIGVKQTNGCYPRIDFKTARKVGSMAAGFTISGSNIYMKFLIIENAGGNGIVIRGNNIILEHIITRYNNNSGIQLFDKATFNTLTYCYSYRNIDVKTYGNNADGFSIKLGAKKITFKYCFAWDNSNNGWGLYDKESDTNISYINSACWNNGNPDVFTGKYDYDHGQIIDNELWTIQQIISSDPSFKKNYNNKKFSISNGRINGEKVTDWLNRAHTKMNGSGFTFGSETTPKNSTVYRKAVYCVAFDHKSKGFDNNNSERCTGYIDRCVSFNNNINYQLPYTFEKWSKNWSWNPQKADQFKQSQVLNSPKNKKDATKAIYSIRDKIIMNCVENRFNDKVNFDTAIRNLI